MTAVDICEYINLPRQARALLTETHTLREFALALEKEKHYVSSIDLLAHGMPVRDAVWWGCLCFRHVKDRGFSLAERAACRAAVQWIIDPSEGNRNAAKPAAEAAGIATAAGALAFSVSQLPANAPLHTSTLPLALASARAIANSVKMSCTLGDPSRIVYTQRLFVELGIPRLEK